MPQRKVKNGERPLPEGWSEAKDVDGKVYFIDHNARETSWIDPRDRFTKPMTFADCIGDELPFGWEEAQDVIVGSYYIDHNLRSNQLEDPRQQWKEEQEIMLREYLHHGKEDLIARQDILGVKGRRLWLAQEEVDTLTTTLQQRQHGTTTMGSKWSINSTTSFIDKYNCDDLKDEIDEAKQRVTKLKSEFQEVSDQVRFQRSGIQKLEEIDKKCLQFGPVQVEEARRMVGEMSNVHQQLEFGELERNDLLASLVELEGNFVFPDLPQSQSGSLCSLALSDSPSHTSQYDLAIDSTTGERRLHKRQLRSEYKIVLNRILELEAAIELVNYNIRASQFAPEQHLHMLMQERLTYLRELDNYKAFVQTEEERMNLELEKQKLAEELLHSEELSCRVMDGQLQLQKEKSALKHELAVKTRLTSLLEQKLKDLSVSTLSMSSGSSHGSLSTGSHGSLSASSRGSLTSLGISSNHIDASGYPHQNVYEMFHQKNYSPIPPIYEAAILNTKSGNNGSFISSQPTTSATSLSSRDSLSASPLSSPPISPYPMPAGIGIGRYYPAQTKGQVSSAESISTSNAESDRSQLSSLASINPLDHDAYSSYRAFSLGSSISDAQGLAQCFNVSKSDESVAADSGVFEATTDCRSNHGRDHWSRERSKTAQLRIALEYDSQEGKLIVSIERGRNATDLSIYKETKQLYVKGSLLPVCTEYNFDFTTRKSTNLAKPVFNDQFLLKIHKSKVINKTLQLDVHGCVSSNRLDYHLGSVQLSLADFDSAKNAGFHWYNVLRKSSTTISQQDAVTSNRAASSLSLDCLRGVDESLFRPSSLLSAHFRGRSNSWSGDLHATLPERDEFGIKTDHEQRDLRSSFVEMSDLIPDGYRLERRSSGRRHLVSQVPSFYRDYIRSKTKQNSQDGSDTSGSTNNLNEPIDLSLHERSKSDESTSSMLSSKSLIPCPPHLARSSSDCTTNTRKFETWSSLARASFERRSLDRRRKAQITQQIDRNATGPTSIDLEMELQSAYMKQAQLDEEITRLKDIKVLMEQAKVEGRTTLPDWVTTNTQFRKLLKQASNDITQRPPSSDKRTINNMNLVRISKADPKQAQIIGFKEKMAEMANPKISVPSNPEVHWV